ncbi:MAG: GNAT family N-acetyltransferase [Caldimonas sp.]
MPMDFGHSIRLASPDDAFLIASLSRDLIEHGLGWSWTPLRVRRSIEDPDTSVILATRNSLPVGFGMMKFRDDEAHLLLLAIQPASARQGVGSALLGWLEASARVAGIGQVYLEARAANTGGRAFYRRLGYGEIQTVPGYYRGLEASVRMAKDLWLQQPESA